MQPIFPVPFRSLRRAARIGVALLSATALAAVSVTPAHAQANPGAVAPDKLPILRDAEIEQLLRDYTRPILGAAHIGIDRNIQVTIVNDRGFNAFVVDGKRIFITVGALLDAQTPNEVIGVLAHETGHIAGGHLARLRQQLEHAQTSSIIALLIGAAAIAGAAFSRGSSSEIGGAAIGLAAGASGLGQRTFLAYQRTEEQAADRAAISFLNATHQSGMGMMRTFQRFATEIEGLTRFIDPYAQSHPMPRERMDNLRQLVETSPYRDAKDPPALQARHDMMRAKISGFLERPDQVARRYPPSDTSLAARYARAIASYRMGNMLSAVPLMDQLIAAEPNNAYFWELKGQALLERGRPREAVAPYRRALQLSNGNGLIRVGLGRALVSAEDPSLLDEAVRELERGVLQEPDDSDGYRFLGIAYARKGDEGRATLASAQGYFIEGALPLAKQEAKRAQQLLPRGSPGWLRADDILSYRRPPGED